MPAKFTTDKEAIDFAKAFVRHRVAGFTKDINICLTADKNQSHAYFPGLMTCISCLELFSGLYAGKLYPIGLPKIEAYAKSFMDQTHYSHNNLELLYKAFRHKLAHMSHPYFVTDTAKAGINGQRRLITWTVYASDLKPPIELISCGPTKLEQTLRPWDVTYDHRVKISVRRLAIDIRKSARLYMRNITTDRTTRKNFEKCMVWFYPV